MTMTTVRVRKLRKATRDSIDQDLGDMTDPVEVMVCGEVRSVVHFPTQGAIEHGGVVMAWWQDGWDAEEVREAMKETALHSVILSDKTQALW